MSLQHRCICMRTMHYNHMNRHICPLGKYLPCPHTLLLNRIVFYGAALSLLPITVSLTRFRITWKKGSQLSNCLYQSGPWACLWGRFWLIMCAGGPSPLRWYHSLVRWLWLCKEANYAGAGEWASTSSSSSTASALASCLGILPHFTPW